MMVTIIKRVGIQHVVQGQGGILSGERVALPSKMGVGSIVGL